MKVTIQQGATEAIKDVVRGITPGEGWRRAAVEIGRRLRILAQQRYASVLEGGQRYAPRGDRGGEALARCGPSGTYSQAWWDL